MLLDFTFSINLDDYSIKKIIVDLCQYFGQKKLKDYATLFSSSSSFC